MTAQGVSTTMRARVIRALIVVAFLTAFLPWVSGDRTVLGIQHGAGMLFGLACLVGVALHIVDAKPTWMALGFAAGVAFREIPRIGDSGLSAGIGVWAGAIVATSTALLLILNLLTKVRTNQRDT